MNITELTFKNDVSVHLVDIWNIIEAFRENGLNTLDPNTGVKVSISNSL